MIIGALLDSGLPFDDFKLQISKLNLSGYELSSQKVTRNHISATQFNVKVIEKQPHRSLAEIEDIISKSKLEDAVKADSIKIFQRLGEAEAKAHGEPIDKVHFHEVGAVDAIIDICGAVLGLRKLGIEKIYSSPLSLGSGMINTDHGLMPIPAPATAELIKGIPSKITDITGELTTPTGAAIITTLAKFEDPGVFNIQSTGYGAGGRELKEIPNLLRVNIGESLADFEYDSVTMMETNLDRVTAENLGGLISELMRAGALDVYITPIVMKKNRPGHLLSVLCENDKKDKLAKMIFHSGKTLGIRTDSTNRIKLARQERSVNINGAEINIKIAKLDSQSIIFAEYDDMVKAMEKLSKSYDEIYCEILRSVGKD